MLPSGVCITLTSASVTMSLGLAQALLPIFYKYPCDYIGPLENLHPLKILNVIVLAKFFLLCKVMFRDRSWEFPHGHLCETLFRLPCNIIHAVYFQVFLVVTGKIGSVTTCLYVNNLCNCAVYDLHIYIYTY